MHSIVVLTLLYSLFGSRGAAQQPSPIPGESAAAVAAPPPSTPAQDRYLQGFRTAARGIAQIKDGISRVVRTRAARDTLQARQAAKRLGALCGAARGFIASGRAQMEPTAYELPTRGPARDLVSQLDSLSLATKTCQVSAGKTPVPVTTELLARLRVYETAVAAFRTAIGLPNRQ
jgi:hypothetical protein